MAPWQSIKFRHFHFAFSALFLVYGALQFVELALYGIYFPSTTELWIGSLSGCVGMILSFFHRASHFGYLHEWSMRRSALMSMWLLFLWSRGGIPTLPTPFIGALLAVLCAAANWVLEVRALSVAEPKDLRRNFGTIDWESQRQTAIIVNSSYFSFHLVVLAAIVREMTLGSDLSFVACVEERYPKQWLLFSHMAMAAASTTAVGTFTGTLAVKKIISHETSTAVAAVGTLCSFFPLAVSLGEEAGQLSYLGWTTECFGGGSARAL